MDTIKTKDVREWLKTLIDESLFNKLYIDKRDINREPKEKQLGVYYTKNNLDHIIEVMGGYASDYTEYFTLLITGTTEYDESRDLAFYIFNKIAKEKIKEPLYIKNYYINEFEFITQPIDVSDFEKVGVYEFVINFRINYEYYQ